MNKKLLVLSVFLSIAAVLSVVLLLQAPKFYSAELSLPPYIENVQKIIINRGMTIVYKNGVWCSYDDYFYPVDNQLVDSLLSDLQKAALYAEEYDGDVDGKDELVMVSSAGNKVKLFFDEDKNYTQKIVTVFRGKKLALKGDFIIPSQPYQWFMQPLLAFRNTDIEKISGVAKDVFSFDDLMFYQVTKTDDFETWEPREITVVLKNGLIVDLIIYAKGHSYWVSVKFDTTVMPTLDVEEYIKNNGSLYDGWFFELPQPVGSRLFGGE